MEFSMRNLISYTALGVALAAGASVAQAQTVETVIAPQPSSGVIAQQPVAAPPAGVLVTPSARTVQAVPIETVETVRTVRSTTTPKVVTRRVVRSRTANRVTTTRTTTVRQGIVTTPAFVAAAPAVAAIAEPTYTEVMRGPRLYDVVTPAPGIATQPVPFAPGTMVPTYRYVYQPDRILVIDPYTNIAVQSIPR
jgi:hypothetical protein